MSKKGFRQPPPPPPRGSMPPPPGMEPPTAHPLTLKPLMAQDSRMLIRMLGVQTAQSFILNRKGFRLGTKILTVFLIFFALLAYDLNHFF